MTLNSKRHTFERDTIKQTNDHLLRIRKRRIISKCAVFAQPMKWPVSICMLKKGNVKPALLVSKEEEEDDDDGNDDKSVHQ